MNIDEIKKCAVKKALERELETRFSKVAQVADYRNEPPLDRIDKIRSLLDCAVQLLEELEKQ